MKVTKIELLKNDTLDKEIENKIQSMFARLPRMHYCVVEVSEKDRIDASNGVSDNGETSTICYIECTSTERSLVLSFTETYGAAIAQAKLLVNRMYERVCCLPGNVKCVYKKNATSVFIVER